MLLDTLSVVLARYRTVLAVMVVVVALWMAVVVYLFVVALSEVHR